MKNEETVICPHACHGFRFGVDSFICWMATRYSADCNVLDLCRKESGDKNCRNCGAITVGCTGDCCERYVCDKWQPIKQEKPMKKEITNEQIVEACQDGIDNRWKLILGGKTLGEVAKCGLCDLFLSEQKYNPSECKKCPFLGDCNLVTDKKNSYVNFYNHYHEMHGKYLGGDPANNEHIACPECERLVKNIISDLEKIIEDHKKVEHIYSVGDVFGNIDGTTSILGVHYGNNKVGFYNEYENIWSQCDILVEDPDNIPEKQIKHLLVIKSHISGPTFKPVNRCKHGFVFGEDWGVCGVSNRFSNCNPLDTHSTEPGREGTITAECKELSKSKGGKHENISN